MRKSITLFLFTILTILHAELIIHKEFNITKSQKASIYYDDTMYAEGFTVTIGQDKIKLKVPEDFEGLEFILKWVDKKDLITIDDYNFDGYSDIGIVHSVGYGGTNIFADYHFYDPKSHTYKRYMEWTANLEIAGERLISIMKDGPFWYRYEYKIKDKKPYKEIEALLLGEFDFIEKFNSQGEVISAYYKPTHVTISAKRAYLYSEPKEDKKTKAYLTKGNKVKILDHKIVLYGMVKVEYKGKKKSYKVLFFTHIYIVKI